MISFFVLLPYWVDFYISYFVITIDNIWVLDEFSSFDYVCSTRIVIIPYINIINLILTHTSGLQRYISNIRIAWCDKIPHLNIIWDF